LLRYLFAQKTSGAGENFTAGKSYDDRLFMQILIGSAEK